MAVIEKTARTDLSMELLCAQWVIPVEPLNVVLADHAVAVEDGRIVAVLPTATAIERWPQARRTLLPGQALIPGLVNLHTHAAMSILRGAGDDLPLERWLNERIWPLEKQLISPEFVYDGAVMAAREMLLGGITCFNDMYFFPEQTARAARLLGMRATIGIVVIDFPSAYGSGPAEYLRKGLELRDDYREDPLIRFSLAPHAPYTVSDQNFVRAASLAAELGLTIHTHLHETAVEVAESLKQYGKRPLRRLHDLGLLGPDLIAVHAVHLDDDDINLLAEAGASVAHCPHSNLKLASGIAPMAALARRGVNVGIGTDGSASNNRLDLFSEARTAALLAKGISGDATVWPAHNTLRAMTLGGAQALGLGNEIGSIEPGKAADLVAVDLSDSQYQPVFDADSHLIYAAGRETVSQVWINGKLVVSMRQLVDSDAASEVSEVAARSRLWHNRVGEILSASRGN